MRENFDIIIEDGLHEFAANKCFFENSIHKLRDKGYFIIEDLDKRLWKDYEELLATWRRQYPALRIELVDIPSLLPDQVSNVLVVAHKI